MENKKIFSSIFMITPFVMCLFAVPRSFITMHLNTDTSASIKWKYHSPFFCLLMFIGEFLAGLFFLYTDYQTNKSTIDQKLNTSHSYIILVQFKKREKSIENGCSILTYSLICLASFLDFISVTGTFLISALIGESSNTSFALKVFQIITTGFACYLVFKTPLFKHQYLASGLIMIGILLKTFNQLSSEIQVWYHLLLLLILFILASIQETLLRWIMDERHISPLRLLCFEGLFGILICSIVLSMLYSISCPHESLCQIGSRILDLPLLLSLIIDHWPTLLYLIGFIVLSGGFNSLGRYVVYYLTPTHRLIADTFCSVFVWIIPLLLSSETDYGQSLFLNISCYSLLMLGCLIYNEVIIINLCGLQEFTRREIIKRSIDDSIFENMGVMEVTDSLIELDNK